MIDTNAFRSETAERRYVFEAKFTPSFNVFELLVIKINVMMSIFSSRTRTEVKLKPKLVTSIFVKIVAAIDIKP